MTTPRPTPTRQASLPAEAPPAPPAAAGTSPKLFLYSLLVPALLLAGSLATTLLLPGYRPGGVGLVVVVVAAVWITCRHFATHYRRQFSRSETVRLVLYAWTWLMLIEGLVLYSLLPAPGVAHGTGLALSGKAIVLTLGITAVIDAFVVTIAYTIGATGQITRMLKAMDSKA